MPNVPGRAYRPAGADTCPVPTREPDDAPKPCSKAEIIAIRFAPLTGATSPDWVFILAAAIAFAQILLSLLVPRNPSAGNETRLRELRGPGAMAVPAE